MLKSEFMIAPDHPALAGHFPDHPVVPGVVTLDHVAQALQVHHPELRIDGFPQVKFLKPLLPAMQVELSLTRKNDTLFQFQCSHQGEVIASGQLRVVPMEKHLG